MSFKANRDSIMGKLLSLRLDVRASCILDHKDTEFRFMREVIYNYLDTEIHRQRRLILTKSETNKAVTESVNDLCRIDEMGDKEESEIISSDHKSV